MTSTSPQSLSLKQLLGVGTALLQPPAPLPSSPPELLDRLRQSSALVPPEWRQKAAWSEDDELDEIGDDENQNDPARRKQRRDALVLLAGLRCLDIITAMQALLVKEFWPLEQRGGLDAKDFLLGTADLRLVRLMLTHVVSSALLTLVSRYVAGLPRTATNCDPQLLATLHGVLTLIDTPQAPASTSSSSTSTSTSTSTRAPLPPTSITQTIVTSHLTPIIIGTVAVGWTPTSPPAAYASLRSELLRVLGELPATQAMASLGTALKLLQSGKSKKQAPRGWVRPWPGYVEGAIGTLMSGQVQRSGGVKAVMENVFGEASNMLGPEGVDGPKLDQIAGVLSRVPRNVAPEVYIPQLLTTLFDLIAPESASHPLIYTHTAAYVVHHLWSTSPIAVQWLDNKVHSMWRPQNPAAGAIASADAVQAGVRTLAELVTHSPPSPDFIDFLLGPILPPLFALHAKLNSSLSAKSIEKRPETFTGLKDEVKALLVSWGKVVAQDNGVKGVWDIIMGGKGWPDEGQESGLELFWRKVGDGAELVYGYPEVPLDTDSTTKMDVDMDDEQGMLDQLQLSPDPPTFATLLKEFERPDISSEVFLKVLGQWRVRVNADDENPVPALLFLRLTLAMMDTLGDKLLSNPEHVLSFVEGVLNDAVQALPGKQKSIEVKEEPKEKRPLIQIVDDEEPKAKGPLIEEMDQDEPLPELTEQGVEKMGMVETAISLLIASLEANEKMNHASIAILHPISDHLEALSHSPSSAIRNLAREASLVLLIRRSASLTSEDGQVSPAVATYRRAIKLVSDELLPVRAHGLVLLRDLVLSKDYDPALTPSIRDVYMKSILDKDSYIYLNAVKGLAAMVDALGKDIFRTLVREYRSNSTDHSGDHLDRVLRIGEALGMVIRRAGKSFSAYADIIVPTLLSTFPDQSLPTILRTSALSLLSTAAEMDHLALLPWSNDLTSAAIDLVQVETVTSPQHVKAESEPEALKPKPKVVLIDDEEPEEEAPVESKPRIVDEEPTKQDSKHPALRRAAVVLLGLLMASIIEASTETTQNKQQQEFQMRLPGSAPPPKQTPSFGLNPATLDRAANILRYVALTDVDEVVRGQASEVVALVERLKTVRATQEIGARKLL